MDDGIRRFVADDVRRITANWVEYAGGMLNGKAERRRSRDVNPDTLVVNPERAVFDVETCFAVGRIRQERTRNYKGNIDYSVHVDSKAYPLSKLIYCAHCEQIAIETDNKAGRSYLTGKTGSKVTTRRYRHDTERPCPTHARSVKAEPIEGDFVRLLQTIAIHPDAIPLFMQTLKHLNEQSANGQQENAIQAEIAHWRKRIKNTNILFQKAHLDEDEWRQSIEEAEHEIAKLQTQVGQGKDVEDALRLNLNMITNLSQSWTEASDDIRRSMANSLFEYLVYDLDAQRIVDFQLKPWASLVMQLKITLEGDNKIPPNADERKRVLWCGWRASATKQHHCLPQAMPLAWFSICSTVQTKANGKRAKSANAMLKFTAATWLAKIA